MEKNRVPMRVSPEFEKRIKDLQKKIRKKTGENISVRKITENMVKIPDFDRLERELLTEDEEFQLNLDRRKR